MKPLVTFDLRETLIFDLPGKTEQRREYRLALFERALHDLGQPTSSGPISPAARHGFRVGSRPDECFGEE
jgi:hypothetical protein